MTDSDDIDKKKQIIGLFGEMKLSMELHNRGWQVHKSFIDEGLDFVISKYWCESCKCYVERLIRKEKFEGKNRKTVTNLCNKCGQDSLKIITRYLQVKTSEGVNDKENSKEFSFHPKIRYDIDDVVFYVWIAVFSDDTNNIDNSKLWYYIFNTNEVVKFDDINIATYQITDNQKTSLRINKDGVILNKGKKYDYTCFKDFLNNFECLEKL